MNHLVQYTSCPVCKNQSIHQVLEVKDFTVSNELFPIMECNGCGLRFTQNIPCETAIQQYYQSSNYISHSNSKKGIINRLYHFARTFTMMSKEALVRKATGRSVGMLLDVGSGTGTFVHTMAVAGWNVVGVEPDAAIPTKVSFELIAYSCKSFQPCSVSSSANSTALRIALSPPAMIPTTIPRLHIVHARPLRLLSLSSCVRSASSHTEHNHSSTRRTQAHTARAHVSTTLAAARDRVTNIDDQARPTSRMVAWQIEPAADTDCVSRFHP